VLLSLKEIGMPGGNVFFSLSISYRVLQFLVETAGTDLLRKRVKVIVKTWCL